ncbi:hypothetical protein PF005_g22733 [Phytophthora fragariae]|uniref:Uncharacterized protein n=1 Tax=Phytophthora fragariae TaxID=53985 RepID=A0A6A3S2A5_9STRA|nr:hypothetical protein PF003_g28731 [Phytophthora fragariae]KAE8926155.1 hypothetical protein PF009_g23650 [Phytophthora fragariae]KAE8982762.1 hypothetical protein PF011_g21480 [Phytophthora fragariae]KAE9080647.1 hypothetical protein PF010_g22301 [Phytophthora fragariae]KAE9080979.1 hypothetical protein PF007_g22835 [Phytophthora fragariae]
MFYRVGYMIGSTSLAVLAPVYANGGEVRTSNLSVVHFRYRCGCGSATRVW